MKILIAGQAFYQHNNGQAVFTINLAEGLVNAGHQVLVMAPSEKIAPYRKEQNGVEIQTVPTLPLKYNANVTALSDRLVANTVAAFAPDVVHIQDHYFLSRSVLRAAEAYSIKRIGTNHFLPENIMDNLRLPIWLRSPLEHWLWGTMLTVYNRLDGVTTPTETAVKIVQQAGLRPPVRAISCGVDSWQFRPRPELDRSALRRTYGLHVDKTMLLFVGRVDHEKCLDVIIQALALLPRQDLQFVIAGAGSHQHTLVALAQELGVAERVIFTGYVPERDLPLLLNSADAFVMPGHAELQSIATLEAMASGLPVIAANARALPELVTPDVNGYLFTADDSQAAAQSITALLENRPRWLAMGAAGRQIAAAHSTQSTTHLYLEWYERVPHLAEISTKQVKPATPGLFQES
ncbi:MAG: glycosyltransferase [Caldilineaceae bacterium]